MIILRTKIFSTEKFYSIFPEEVKLKNGICIKKTEPNKFFRFLGKHIKPLGRSQENFIMYDIFIEGNKKDIGFFSAEVESKDSVNLSWLRMDTDYRNRGIAQEVLKSFIEHIKSLHRFKTITLEVPDISESARHIYTKLGFKEDGRIGNTCLTKMKLKL